MSLVEAATEPVAPPESESVNTHKFRCDRHPGNSYAYRTWKAYIEHCRMMGEAPQAELPEDVAKAYAGAKYVCFMHGATFPKDRTAKQHIHEHHRLRGGRTNLTLEQMQVKKVGAADKKGDR